MDTTQDAPVARDPALDSTQDGRRVRTTALPEIDVAGGEVRLQPRRVDRYREVRKLGAGGMGEVALATDEDIGRTVAIKRLQPDAAPPAIARFVDEIRVVGGLEHPNIVPIHDVGVDADGEMFFVMKYVDGETLEEIIAKLAAGDSSYHRRYTYETRIDICLQVLRALQHAHARGVVHRDIKPANIMVGRQGEVLLMDWGIAKWLDERSLGSKLPEARGEHGDLSAPAPRERLFVTRHAALVGTPAYMSPEQARGEIEAIGERSDVYSVCVVFHELFNLRHYLGDQPSVASMLAAVADARTPDEVPFRNRHPTQAFYPAELNHFVKRGIRKDPADRYQSVAAMIEELHTIIEGKARVECPATFTKRIVRSFGRFVDVSPNAAFVTLLAVLAALACSLAFAAYGAVRALH